MNALRDALQKLLGDTAEVKLIDLDKLLEDKGPQLLLEAAITHAERIISSIGLIAGTDWNILLKDLRPNENTCQCGPCRIQLRYLRKMCHIVKDRIGPIREDLTKLAEEAEQAMLAASKLSQQHNNPKGHN
jgi:hypothetical protein